SPARPISGARRRARISIGQRAMPGWRAAGCMRAGLLKLFGRPRRNSLPPHIHSHPTLSQFRLLAVEPFHAGHGVVRRARAEHQIAQLLGESLFRFGRGLYDLDHLINHLVTRGAGRKLRVVFFVGDPSLASLWIFPVPNYVVVAAVLVDSPLGPPSHKGRPTLRPSVFRQYRWWKSFALPGRYDLVSSFHYIIDRMPQRIGIGSRDDRHRLVAHIKSRFGFYVRRHVDDSVFQSTSE